MALLLPHSPQQLNPNSLYPTLEDLSEAEAYAHSRVPIRTANELHGILTVYKNTLLKQLHITGS